LNIYSFGMRFCYFLIPFKVAIHEKTLYVPSDLTIDFNLLCSFLPTVIWREHIC
jgi:hypothetical protein